MTCLPPLICGVLYFMKFTKEELENEIWKPVVGYEGYYEVSDLGRVRSLTRHQKYTRKRESKYSKYIDEIKELSKSGMGNFKIGVFLNKKYGLKRDSVRNFVKILKNNNFVYTTDVYRPMKGRILELNDNSNGYKFVNISVKNNIKQLYVHRIVCAAFIGEIPDGCNINHKDSIKDNNRLNNLEIVTFNSNSAHIYINKNTSSKYPGVSFMKKAGKYRGHFSYRGKKYFCGHHDNEEDAFDAILKKSKENNICLGKYYNKELYN